MKKVINNNNKYKLKYCKNLQCFMSIGGSLWLALSLLIKGLVKTSFFVNLSKFGTDFHGPKSDYRSQKRPVLLGWRVNMPFFFHPGMSSFRDETSSQQKHVNSKRHFTIERDDFIPRQISSWDEFLSVNTLLQRVF